MLQKKMFYHAERKSRAVHAIFFFYHNTKITEPQYFSVRLPVSCASWGIHLCISPSLQWLQGPFYSLAGALQSGPVYLACQCLLCDNVSMNKCYNFVHARLWLWCWGLHTYIHLACVGVPQGVSVCACKVILAISAVSLEHTADSSRTVH